MPSLYECQLLWKLRRCLVLSRDWINKISRIQDGVLGHIKKKSSTVFKMVNVQAICNTPIFNNSLVCSIVADGWNFKLAEYRVVLIQSVTFYTVCCTFELILKDQMFLWSFDLQTALTLSLEVEKVNKSKGLLIQLVAACFPHFNRIAF